MIVMWSIDVNFMWNKYEFLIVGNKMDFSLGGVPIHNARNIEWKSNGDGTGQLWFDTLLIDKDNKEQNVRFHIFRLKFDDPLMSIESVNNKLYEIEVL